MESTGNLYDYPRESIERRKLLRQLRRVSLESGCEFPGDALGDLSAPGQSDLLGWLKETDLGIDDPGPASGA